jgi:hypothetical protein
MPDGISYYQTLTLLSFKIPDVDPHINQKLLLQTACALTS